MNKILVVGMGSIGRRHAKNLAALGFEIGSVDPQARRHEEAVLEGIKLSARYESLFSVDLRPWDGIVIATPPAFHVEQLTFCGYQKPVLMEKNLCLDLDEIQTLRRTQDHFGRKVLMGYTWRWWRSIEQLRIALPQIGALRRAEFTMAAHLADWHPWERIEDFYAASRGGVLNEAHWHDIMLMLFGPPQHLFASFDKISDLPIPTPDVLDMTAFYPGFRVNLHYDLFKRPHERSARFTGERGTLEWTPNCIRIAHFKDGAEWRKYRNSDDRNSMFAAMAADFAAMVRGQPIDLRCTLRDGVNVMRALKLCALSNETKATVAWGDCE